MNLEGGSLGSQCLFQNHTQRQYPLEPISRPTLSHRYQKFKDALSSPEYKMGNKKKLMKY